MNNIYTRVSIRKYQDKTVESEKTEAILRAAMQAPSAANQQPWEFYVVTDKAKLEALSKASPYAWRTYGLKLMRRDLVVYGSASHLLKNACKLWKGSWIYRMI